MKIPDNTSFELAQIHKLWLNEWPIWIQNTNTGRKEDDYQIQQQMHSGSDLKQTGAIQSQLLLAQARPTLMKSSSLGDSCVCVCGKSWTWYMITFTTVYRCHATSNISFLSFYCVISLLPKQQVKFKCPVSPVLSVLSKNLNNSKIANCTLG